jgi:hypothetical protein
VPLSLSPRATRPLAFAAPGATLLCCLCSKTLIVLWNPLPTRGMVRLFKCLFASCPFALIIHATPSLYRSYVASTGIHTASVLLTSAGYYSLSVQLATPGGISAAYYESAWPSTTPSSLLVDSTIGMHAGGDTDGMYSGFSSVRWSGRISSSSSGLHTFYVTSQSGSRCWIDGNLLLDRWVSQCNLTAFTFKMQASALHLIQFDARLSGVSTPIHLQWESAAFPRQFVDSRQLFSTAHVSGSPFDLFVAAAAACASTSTALLRGDV